MADFVTGKELEDAVYDVIFNAKKQLLIVSPFIKLDDYFKKEVFNHQKANPDLHIVVAFGKNQNNPHRSFNRSDFEYFMEFPNISIVYVPTLHAKFYANESKGVITSLNLYDYSFKNNIEFGIISERKFLEIGGETLDTQAWNTSFDIIKESHCVFVKRPVYKKKLLLGRDYMGSEVLLDQTKDLLFGKKLEKRSYLEFEPEEFVDFNRSRERVSREDFESLNDKVSSKFEGKLISGSALGRTKGKRLADVRVVMESEGYVIDNKITPKGRSAGISLNYGVNGESWIVYPESMNSLL